METIQVNVSPHLTLQAFQAMTENTTGIDLVYRINREDGRLKLVYVGKSVEASERVGITHEHYNDWIEWANGQESRLRFSLVILQDHADELLRCEAALIYCLQPPINHNGKDSFSYEDTLVIFNGRQVCCRSQIMAQKTL